MYGPRDTHQLSIHPAAPDRLYSAAGDGYFESHDGGDTWQRFEGARGTNTSGVSPSIWRMRITSSFRQLPPHSAPTLTGGIISLSARGSPWQELDDGLPQPAGRCALELRGAADRNVPSSALQAVGCERLATSYVRGHKMLKLKQRAVFS